MANSVQQLEEILAYQQRLLEELDEVVGALHNRVSTLEKQVVNLRSTAKPGQEGEEPTDEKPPHYGGFGSAAGS